MQRSHGPVNKRLHLLSNNALKNGQLVTKAGIRLTALVVVNNAEVIQVNFVYFIYQIQKIDLAIYPYIKSHTWWGIVSSYSPRAFDMKTNITVSSL